MERKPLSSAPEPTNEEIDFFELVMAQYMSEEFEELDAPEPGALAVYLDAPVPLQANVVHLGRVETDSYGTLYVQSLLNGGNPMLAWSPEEFPYFEILSVKWIRLSE